MRDSAQIGEDWIRIWIDGQRAAAEEWLRNQGEKTPAGDVPPYVEQLKRMAALTEGFVGSDGPGAAILKLWQRFNPVATAGMAFPWEQVAMGPLREPQEELQSLARAYADYERHFAEVQVVLVGVHSETLDLLARSAQERTHAGTPLDGFKALYDLWIECGETTYAKVAHSESYCRLQGELANAAVRVRSFQQALVERWLGELNLPTRSEMNTLHRRMRDLQRRLENHAVPPAVADNLEKPVAPQPPPRRAATAVPAGRRKRTRKKR